MSGELMIDSMIDPHPASVNDQTKTSNTATAKF